MTSIRRCSARNVECIRPRQAPIRRDGPSPNEFAPSPGVETFAYRLAEQFDVELARLRQFGLDPILGRWRVAAHPPGTALTVHEPNGALVSGAFDGLAPDGALRLRLEDGTCRVIHAGDVSLKDS